MENSFQTSFIPKKPITTVDTVSRPSKSIFSILAVLLLVIMGVASGGLFLYKNYLIKQQEVLASSLDKTRDSFEKDTIDELELYDKRVSASKQVLEGHTVLSPLFSTLGDLTIPGVQFTKFSHETNEKGFFVKMNGVARDYRSIALQADVFNTAKGRSFKNVVFSNLIKDKSNYINFNIDFEVDPSLLSYQKNVLLEGTQVKARPTFQPQAEPAVQNNQQPQVTPTPVNANPETVSVPVNNKVQ